jgi:hypothetical protein
VSLAGVAFIILVADTASTMEAFSTLTCCVNAFTFQQNGVLSVSENAAPLSMTMTAPLLNDLACCERRYVLSKDVAIVYDY